MKSMSAAECGRRVTALDAERLPKTRDLLGDGSRRLGCLLAEPALDEGKGGDLKKESDRRTVGIPLFPPKNSGCPRSPVPPFPRAVNREQIRSTVDSDQAQGQIALECRLKKVVSKPRSVRVGRMS